MKVKGFCEKIPNERYHKTGKHFFSQPTLDGKIENTEKFKEIKSEILKPITLSQIVAKIKKNLADQNLDLTKILDYHDKSKTGIFIILQCFFFILFLNNRNDNYDSVFLYHE